MTQASGRLLALLSLLQARRDWPGRLLAQRLDVTARTVRRDVERLRELGYTIRAVKGPEGGYRLERTAGLPPLLLDEEQAVALAVALQVAESSGADIGDAATRALATVRRAVPGRLRSTMDSVRVSAVEPAGTDVSVKVDSTVLVTLSAAVRDRSVLRFDYAGAENPHRVEPYHVITAAGRWFLVGWDLDLADWRVFRADRITPLPPLGPRFTPRTLPGGTVQAFARTHLHGINLDHR